jgi:hypothetical protein
MISFFIKHTRFFLWLTLIFFLGSLGLVGASIFSQEYGYNSAVAKVGEVKIKRKTFESAFKIVEAEILKQGKEEYNEELRRSVRARTLQEMINEECLALAAQNTKIGVCDMEIAYEIKNSPAFGGRGAFSKRNYFWVVRNVFSMTPAEYEKDLKKKKLAAKFQNMLVLSAKATPQESEMFAKSDAALEKAFKKDKNGFALALIQIKAQALMDKFTQQFNGENDVKVFGYGI